MTDRRQKLKEHIRAAREWLGQAENSLEREDDVKGSLKILLAKAELQRAEETKRVSFWQRFLLRASPLAIAVVAAFVIWNFSSQDDNAALDATPAESVSRTTEEIVVAVGAEEKPPVGLGGDEAENVAAGKEEALAALTEGFELDARQEQIAASSAVYESAESSGDMYADSGVYADSGTKRDLAAEGGLPSGDMQKLMQSAYFSLRKE